MSSNGSQGNAEGRAYRVALAAVPDDFAAAGALGTLSSRLGALADGLRVLSRVTRHLPGDADGHGNLGSALLAGSNISAAQTSLRRAIALHPGHVDGHYNLGLAHHQSAMHERAQDCYRRAIGLRPAHLEARRNLAVALHATGRIPDAVARMRQLISERPERPDIKENLVLALLDGGYTQEAIEVLIEVADRRFAPGGEPFPPRSRDRDVTQTKLTHDRDQLDHVIQQGRATAEMRGARDLYAGILSQVPADIAPAQPLVLPGELSSALSPWYARRYLRWIAPAAAGRALHPALDLDTAGRRYLTSTPELVVVDDLLSDETLAALRRFCMENSFWVRSYGGGYLGSFMEDGFACPLLAQIADELRDGMPSVIGAHTLKKIWGFKYDSRLSGINLHADFAAVNVNFWITPDAANQDPACGGLVVWDKPAPLTWGFQEYNRSPEQARRYLDDAASKAIVVPHRTNRAVIFNSNLFHETDRIAFKDGYENRRINITFLYGNRS